MQQTVGISLCNRIIHQGQAGGTADEAFFGLAAQNIGKERLCCRQAGQDAVVANIRSVHDTVGRVGQNRQNIADQVQLCFSRFAAGHVQLQSFGLQGFQICLLLLQLFHLLGSTHAPVVHCFRPFIT